MLKQLFRDVVKAITGDAPVPTRATRRKRGDDTRGVFSLAARKIVTRTARLPQETYRTAAAYLWDTLEWLNQWQACDDGFGEDFHDAPRDHLYPHL